MIRKLCHLLLSRVTTKETPCSPTRAEAKAIEGLRVGLSGAAVAQGLLCLCKWVGVLAKVELCDSIMGKIVNWITIGFSLLVRRAAKHLCAALLNS